MSSASLETRILVVDPDPAYAERLRTESAAAAPSPAPETPDAKPIRVVVASSLSECQRLLSDRDYSYVGVFVNPSLGHPSWAACIRSAHQYRPGVPAYIIYGEKPKATPEQLKQAGAQGFLQLPLSFEDLLRVIRGETEVPATLDGAAAPAPAPSAEPAPVANAKGPTVTDADVIAVDLTNRATNVASLFDLYIKLSSGRYIQILNKGDRLTRERLTKYKEHGATSLYVPKSQREEYLSYCELLVTSYLKDPAIPVAKKAEEVARHGAETLDLLRRAGFGPGSIERARKYVVAVTEGMGQLALKSPMVKDWFTNVALLDHSVAIVSIAGLMLKNIGVIKQETHHAVGIACFLHDCGLAQAPEELREEDESRMTAEQKAIFYEHPIHGAQLLAKDKAIPPGVAKAVEQHHLRINGGFPAVKGVMDLSAVAEIIGISEDFCRLLQRAQKDPTLDPVAQIRDLAGRNYSKLVSAGFLRTLQDK